MNSRKKILLGVFGAMLWIIGDYLLGINSYQMGVSADTPFGVMFNVVPDWRYAASSILGALAIPFAACASIEILRILRDEYGLEKNLWYRLFYIANWAGIFYFAFIHIGICMLALIYNGAYAAIQDAVAAFSVVLSVAKNIAVPLGVTYVIADGFVMLGWFGMILTKKIPLKKYHLICTPVVTLLLANLLEFIPFPFTGADSGFESLGWLLMYLVCAKYLTGEKRKG